MAKIKSSKKRILISEIRRKKNFSKRSMIKTFIKKLKLEIISKNKKSALILFKKIQSILDSYSKKNLIHKNKASRYKSNLFNKIKNIS